MAVVFRAQCLSGFFNLKAGGLTSFGVRAPWGMPRAVRRQMRRLLGGAGAVLVVAALITLGRHAVRIIAHTLFELLLLIFVVRPVHG